MVDAEKPQNEEITDLNNPTQPMEGGETDSQTSEEAKEENQVQEIESINIMEMEGQEYSEDEYNRFVEFYDRTLSDIRQGEIVVGRILAITDQEVLVDIGFKSEGTISLEEFGDPSEVKVGDRIEVFLDSIEDADGQLVLSKKKATFMRLWDKVVDIEEKGGTIEGKCVRRIKGGIVVDLMGVDAFLPGSQIDVKPIRDFDALIGQIYTFKVVKVNKLRKNIVVSRRALLEESMAEQREKVLDDLEKGQLREGTVKNITDFGVFVDLGGVDGLLHINDLSWGRINHPSEIVKLDEKITVMILDFNDSKDRISLGIKQLQPHPWESIGEKYPEEQIVKGKVVSIADYGAFVELERGVEGLIHVSEMSWTRHGIHPSKIVNVGEVIDVKILSVDKNKKRISLGIKQLTPDPWEDIVEKYPIGSKYMGRVRNMTNFGVFVEMEEGIDGLIHISDLSWTRKIKHPSEVLKKGEEIEVVVLDVNKGERRVSLGYKQLTDDPWPAFEEAYKVGTLTSGKVIRFVEKGLIVELPLGLEGFVPLSQLVETSMAKVSQTYKEGDDSDFVVIEFDRTNKRVVLSKKRLLELEQEKGEQAEKAEVDSFMNIQEEKSTLADVAGELTEEKEKKDKEEPEETKSQAESTAPVTEEDTPKEKEDEKSVEETEATEPAEATSPVTEEDTPKEKEDEKSVEETEATEAAADVQKTESAEADGEKQEEEPTS